MQSIGIYPRWLSLRSAPKLRLTIVSSRPIRLDYRSIPVGPMPQVTNSLRISAMQQDPSTLTPSAIWIRRPFVSSKSHTSTRQMTGSPIFQPEPDAGLAIRDCSGRSFATTLTPSTRSSKPSVNWKLLRCLNLSARSGKASQHPPRSTSPLPSKNLDRCGLRRSCLIPECSE